jgi:glycosyltransferase involved in cell wall biosynthesis
VVEHGVTGFLAPVGDVDTMAGYCLKLLSDCEEGKKYGEAARRRASEKFDFRSIVPLYERIYERLLAGRREMSRVTA